MVGFIIMQIGDEQLDEACEKAIVPAIEANGLDARRVDKHNKGGLLKSEIIEYISDSEILVADLTNERPNVYLEIGYAMGIDKFRNLILTVREDHFLDHPDRKPGDPKIHFDLAGYDILSWDPNDLSAFKAALQNRIAKRLALVDTAKVEPPPIFDIGWIEEQRELAAPGLDALATSGRMEVRFALHPPKPSFDLSALREAARRAQIHTFGWPIGVFGENNEAMRPKPRADGIAASISARLTGPRYDYWVLRRNGDYFLTKSLFEEERDPGLVYFNTRIVRVTETLMFCHRLYSQLGVDRAATVSIAIRHSGLKGRRLGSSNPNRDNFLAPTTEQDETEAVVVATLDQLEANLVTHVKAVLAPMFELFDFFQLNDGVYEDIVTRFVAGEVS